jgi:hypothetical protein
MSKERLALTDSMMDVYMKMSDGNPGGLNVLMGLMKESETIDPEGGSGLMKILQLDNLGIYGSAIYCICSDKCGRDLRKFILLLRAVQLGFFDRSRLIELAKDQRRELTISKDEWCDMEVRVTEFLPAFAKESA